MYYIQAISSITHQASFRSANVFEDLQLIDKATEIVSPDYKEFIPGNALRRLSPVLRMGLAASIECKNQVGLDFDSIVVGTALGCLKDTEKFLNTIHTTTSDFLSPTAFIQSTHNTIGGQISLGLKNHAYNMTHTQNSLSFEVSLLDAMMCINEGKKNVLVGAADEKIDFLEHLQPSIISDTHPLSSGASFFALSGEKDKSRVCINSVGVTFADSDLNQQISEFLSQKGLNPDHIDIVLHSNNSGIELFDEEQCINFLDYSGLYYSASAFAVHMAHDYLMNSDSSLALVVNTICDNSLGMILLEKDEA